VYCWRNITGQANETVADIAGRYKADPERLARFNNLAGAATTVANRTLCIPDIYATGYIAPPTTSGGATYIVQQGDTLLAIANRYGITVMRLQQANGLRHVDYIEIGQPLQIP
jgi:LysM repeat protein